MKEPEIVVLSEDIRFDDYGKFIFIDKAGSEHRIGPKRENFEELCATVREHPDRAVELTFDEYKGRSYIVGIKLLDKQIIVEETNITKQHAEPPTIVYTEVAKPVAPQELGMWWKEMGNRIGDGSIERDFPKTYVKIKSQYYKKLFDVTGVDAKEKKGE